MYQSKENNAEPTYLAWPSGEWSDSLLKALTIANISIEGYQNKKLSFALPTLNIIATICRANDVINVVRNPRTKPVVGITGTDIWAEYNLQLPESDRCTLCKTNYMDFFPSLPVKELVPEAPNPRLSWLVTPNAVKDFGEDLGTWEQWAKGTIYTSFPFLVSANLPENIKVPIIKDSAPFGARELPQPRIQYVPGKVEGFWRSDPNNYVIADIIDKGDSAQANELIEIFPPILSPITLIMFIDEAKTYYEDMIRMQNLLEILNYVAYELNNKDE